MRLNAKQIALYTGGQFQVTPIDPSALMTGLTWDSREVKPGDLYVALIGERVDGHSFVSQALKAGAAGALVMAPLDSQTTLLAEEMGAAVIEVPDTAHAVADLAREWRGHLKGRVIGLTGSVGKTTTKNLIRDVCEAGCSVIATLANQNNELGVPNTILRANPETDVVIVEMGMRGLGQIAALCELARPEWGVITNIGESHLELLGTQENIARAKGELLEALPSGIGRAFVNAADPFTPMLCEIGELKGRYVTCIAYDGADIGAHESIQIPVGPRIWAEDIRLDPEGRPVFTLCSWGFDRTDEVHRTPCSVGLRGLHNVSNACAAAAVGLSLGLDLEVVAKTLGKSLPEQGRQEVFHAPGGYMVVNDAYNANPDSMKASLSMFGALRITGMKYAVLGDMAELGDYAEACHEGVGHAAAAEPLDGLICVGELARSIAEGARDAGMDEKNILCVSTVGDVLGILEDSLEPGDAVLVKASHCMGLTRVVEGLIR